MEEVEDDSIELKGQFGIVANAFVAHEGVSSVDFIPTELRADFIETGQHDCAAFERGMRVLASPDHQQLALDVLGTLERIVVHALAQAALVYIGCIEAN